MSYEDVEDALATQVQAIGTDIVVAKHNFSKIQTGTKRAAILKYGRFSQRRSGMSGVHQIDWSITIQLLARYTTDDEVRPLLREFRQAVINRINQYPRLALSAQVVDALITQGEPLPEEVTLGGARFLSEFVLCVVTEELEVDYQE